MQTINANKDEQPTQTTVDYLTAEDRKHCDHVYSIYNNHVTHVSELLQSIDKKNEDYESKNLLDDQNFSCLSKIDKAIEALQDILQNLTKSLVKKLEDFFRKKYCLFFLLPSYQKAVQ